jgi:phosphohistidine phosphatase
VGTGKTLVVMRHAKAEPYAESDAARQLTARGRTEAAGAGQFLLDARLVPDHALVSSAARTRETWEIIRETCDTAVDADLSDAMYAASPPDVLDAVREVPAGTRTCLYLGHNPTAAHVAAALDDGEADPEVLRGLLAGFPTSALAVFAVPGEWADLAEAGARLMHFYPGR